MKYIYIIIVSILLFSCVKIPTNNYVSPLNIPANFNWKTIEAKKVILSTASSIFNEDGDTIAEGLSAGTYNIVAGKNSVLTIIPDPEIPQTKAISGIKKYVYFPAKSKYATVFFEDLFPSKGDMDMNDIAFGLYIRYLLDNQSNVLGIEINIQPRAIGSLFALIGLAANLSSDTPIDIVQEIVHSRDPYLSPLFSTSNPGGPYQPEAGITTSQVIPITGNYRGYFNNIKDLFLNVRDVDPVTTSNAFKVTIDIIDSKIFPYSNMTFLDSAQEGKINLDIFAMVFERGREIHFKGQKPTQKFSLQYFSSTRPKTDFSTSDNWVWAIISDKSIRYPKEYVKIYNAYPNFKVWAESGGIINSTWYSPSVADSLYRKSNFSYIN